jgi:hypothetical protein
VLLSIEMKSVGFQLNGNECQVLAKALGDTPHTVGSAHVLRRGLCNAYITGTVDEPTGVVVQSNFGRTEPVGFGSSPALLWDLLMLVDGWDCFLVDFQCSQGVAELMRSHTGRPVGFIQELSFQLDSPAKLFTNPSVRLLTADDSSLLAAAAADVAGSGYRDPEELLTQGIAAAAIVDDGIVSIAHTTARSERYADIGVHTLEPFRRRGFARAAASLVAMRVQEEGQTPVWSAGHFNTASLTIAKQLGFTEISRRTYVITDEVPNWRFAQQLRPGDAEDRAVSVFARYESTGKFNVSPPSRR